MSSDPVMRVGVVFSSVACPFSNPPIHLMSATAFDRLQMTLSAAILPVVSEFGMACGWGYVRRRFELWPSV